MKNLRDFCNSKAKLVLNLNIFALCLFILLVPIMINNPNNPIFPSPIDGKIQLSEIAFFLLFIVWIKDLIQKKIRITPTFFNFFVGLYLVCSLLSLINSDDLGMSLVAVCGLIYLVIIYFIFAGIKNRSSFELVIIIWLVASLVCIFVGVIGLVLYYIFGVSTSLIKVYPQFPFVGSIFRIISTFPTSKMLSSYLTISIPMAFCLFLVTKNRTRKKWLVLAVIIMVVAMVFTFSRGWIGFGVSLLVLLPLFQKEWINRLVKPFLIVIIVTSFLVVNLISVWNITSIKAANLERKENRAYHKYSWPVSEGKTTFLRVDISYEYMSYFLLKKAAIRMVQEHPLTGVGLGMFNENIRNLRERGELPKGIELFDPHSTFFGQAAETGLLGLLALLALLFFFGYHTYAISKSIDDFYWKTFLYGFLASFLGLVVAGIDMDIMNFRFLWVLFGLAITVQRLAFEEQKEKNAIPVPIED